MLNLSLSSQNFIAIWLESILFVKRIQPFVIYMLLISISVWNYFVIPQCFLISLHLSLFALLFLLCNCLAFLPFWPLIEIWLRMLPEMSNDKKELDTGHAILLLNYIFWLQSSNKSVLTMFCQQPKLADNVNPHYINDIYVGQHFPM